MAEKYTSTILPEDKEGQKTALDLLKKINEVHNLIPPAYVPPASIAPMYLSNSEPVINTNGVASKTSYDENGAPLLAQTATTYMDMTIQRAILSTESLTVEFRSKINGNWVPAANAGVYSLGIPGLEHNMFSFFNSAVNSFGWALFGVSVVQNTAGVLRLVFSSSASIRHTNFGSSTQAGSYSYATWAQVIAAADGYSRWRIVIK